MSIPPLVCSTPPPPDQCEDDRDTEDFDIHYNLSQDDEDGNDYNYGTYSDYIFSTSTSTNIQDKWSADITKKAECTLPNDLIKENIDNITVLPERYGSTVDKLGFEDTAIEDLNLKLEDENDLASSTSKCDIEPSEIISSERESDTTIDIAPALDNIEGTAAIVTQDLMKTEDADNDIKMLEEGIKPYQEELLNEDDLQETYDIDRGIDDISLNDAATVTNDFEAEEAQQDVPVINNPIDQNKECIFDVEQKDPSVLGHKNDVVDDFGDFDDFHFISSETNPGTTIQFCDNPWDKDKEVSEDSEFGDFTANFDTEEPNSHLRTDALDQDKEDNKKEEFPSADTDDFGDFDDFKSSSNDHTEDVILNQLNQNEPSQSVPVLSMQNNPESEVQIIESISSVLSSIFISEISEHESPFENTLESSLNETWGYLVDTDVRQPYIVNWNNSLGQKSLLKALCIDSRNILFGPKWNSGTPKYAANLTVAPLQPQKPLTPNVNPDDQNIDKNMNKETGSWTDPFTSDGQESCNSEGGSSAPARPTNLDVFTNVTTPNIDKIYSSTLSVQPIRQINLPDTHIFTPTDSETPRSKTIHYDHGSVLVLPPPEENHQAGEALSESKNDVPVNNSENDEDYWEFQDFKGSVSNKNTVFENPSVNRLNEGDINNSTLPIATNYQTQILQPIKVEPMMPTLNWPAPGEVKDTFDDFSEFVSNTQWTESINVAKQTDSEVNCKNNDEVIAKNDTIIDDFETFQSAPNFKLSVTDSSFPTTGNVVNHNFDDFGQFPDTKEPIHTIHSKTDSVNTVKQKDTFVSIKPNNNSPTVKNNHVKTSPVLSLGSHTSNTVLQPSIAGTSSKQKNQQKAGQILQPLTLESYSQINWPNPGIDLQDLSRFNPVESLQSLKTEVSSGGSKLSSPAHKDTNTTRNNEISDEDIWGDFVSSKPKQQQQQSKKLPVFADDDEWTDFVSSPSVKPANGLSTISLNVHTNLNLQKASAQGKFSTKSNQILDIPPLNYVTPKASNRGMYNDKHFQNL